MTPRDLVQRRRILFTMLTTLGYRYPPGREPPVIAGIRQYLGGWPGIGRIIAGMARQQYDLQLTRFGQDGRSATFYPAGIAHAVGSDQTQSAGRDTNGGCSREGGRDASGLAAP